ncbi:MAG: hypothetical protein LBV60_20735 [Streptomyces sp.]|jgi:hypothetical protein|nr:hypothetical protein [Streptomyces sp.]
MDRLTVIGFGIDVVLTVGLASVIILAAAAAAIPITLGRRAGTAIATRWHARRIPRDAETYLRQPRKETP